MEPPQFIQLTIGLLAAVFVFLVSSYEATFAVLSRSALEKMNEAGIKRAALMLKIYEPRHRLRLLARIGSERLWVLSLLRSASGPSFELRFNPFNSCKNTVFRWQ